MLCFGVFLSLIAGASVGDEPEPKRVISFSGYEWKVKHTMPDQWGPGPNFFSDSKDNVWVDEDGKLHLKIVKDAKGRWTCAEIISVRSFGYGTYQFQLEKRDQELDENVILGFFTWETIAEHNNREIDVEIARWGNADNETNAQFVVQPYQTEGNLERFVAPVVKGDTRYSFTWKKEAILFGSKAGEQVVKEWKYKGPDIPDPGKEKLRFNAWLFNGKPPASEKEVEIVISAFSFQSLSPK